MAEGAADSLPAARLFQRMSMFYSASFLIAGIYGPFFPLWLAGEGYSPTLAAIILALPMFVRIAATPMLTLLADVLGNHRAIILALLALCLACFSAPLLRPGIVGLAILSAANCVAYPAITPLAETFALAGVHRFGLDYGRMRMWGSMTFVLANLAGGAMLARFGTGVILELILGGMALTFAVSLLLPLASDPSDQPARVQVSDIGLLLANPRYTLLLATAAVIQGSHGVLNAFASVSWHTGGLSQGVVGLLWATGVVAEVLMMAFARRGLVRFGTAGLLVVGGSAALLRWIALGFDPPLGLLLPLQLLHGLSFGATHIGAMNELARTVPQRLSATSQGLYAAATAGIAPGATVLLSGPLYTHLGTHAYWVMAAIAAVGLWMALKFRVQPQMPAPLNREGAV